MTRYQPDVSGHEQILNHDKDRAWLLLRKWAALRPGIGLHELFPAGANALLWGLPRGSEFCPSRQIIKLAENLPRRSNLVEDCITKWCEQSRSIRPVATALEAVAWTFSLRRLTEIVCDELWWRLLASISGLCHASIDQQCEAVAMLDRQIRQCELPLALLMALGELAKSDYLERTALGCLNQVVASVISPEGLPENPYFELWPAFLASWARCSEMCSHLGVPAFRAGVVRLLRKSCKYYPCMLDKRGNFRLDDSVVHPEQPLEYFVCGTRGAASSNRAHKPHVAVFSTQADHALLYPGTEAGDQMLLARFTGDSFSLFFHDGKCPLVDGTWETQVMVDGRPLRKASRWTVVCNFSGKEADYLELALDLDNDVELQRQVIFAHADRLLLLVDVILAPREHELKCQSTISLGRQVTFEPASQSNEGWLRVGQRRALVLPLSLPEWRAEPAAGTLDATSNALRLSVRKKAQRLLLPLCIAADTNYLRRPFTWRKLTVAEDLAAVPDELAVGYRIQIGKQQWLFYRSLGPAGNRSVLGHNLISETLLARFANDGTVHQLVEVERQ